MSSTNPFAKISAQYSAWRPRYPAALFIYLADLCVAHDMAWDCATGSGQAAVDLARYFAQVEATDVSTEQIAAATQNAQVRYSVQPAEATTFPDEHFDLITVAQALHWFDHARFWTEVHRVLKPQGVFAAWSYVWPRVSTEIDATVTDKLFKVIRPYWSSKNQLAWDGYRNLEWPFEELPAPDIVFSCDWTRHQFVSFLRTLSATTRCLEQHGDAFLVEFESALQHLWPEQEIKNVKMDFHCRVGRKPVQ